VLGVLGQAIEHVDDVVCVDGAVDLDGERLPRELVDDVEQLDGAAVSGLVELEVQRPDHVRGDRTMAPIGTRCRSGAFVACDRGPSVLLTPEPVDLLVVGSIAGGLGSFMGPPPAPAGRRSEKARRKALSSSSPRIGASSR